jgi:hypothetical protein
VSNLAEGSKNIHEKHPLVVVVGTVLVVGVSGGGRRDCVGGMEMYKEGDIIGSYVDKCRCSHFNLNR